MIRNRLLYAILLIAFVSPCATTNAWQIPSNKPESQDAQLIEGLRIRRLFDLAEAHCRKLLASDDLTTTEQATFAIELIKSQTARAILSREADRDSAWQTAFQTADQFLTKYPRHPREFLIQIQNALAHLARGRLISQELAAEMVPESKRTLALQELRTARSSLSQIQRDIEKAIPEARSKTAAEGELTSAELMALNRNVRYQLAIANASRAELYPADDRLNRIDALNDVLRRLTEVQRETSQGQPLWWDSRILRIECLRLLGRTAEAQSELSQLSTSLSDTEPVPQSLLIQQLKLALESEDFMVATATLEMVDGINDRTPQLDLARVELAMKLAAENKGTANQKWVAYAADITDQMEIQHGPYWGRRAELILIGTSGAPRMNPGSTATTANSTELGLLVRLADQAMRSKRWQDATKAYDRAAETALALGDRQQAFSLSVRGSQALEKDQQHAAAADRLTKLAAENPELELAPAAHLRGCWNWAQLADRDQPSQARFLELLNQHLATWPEESTADQIRLWLAGRLQLASQWESAFSTYLDVSRDSDLLGDALTRAVYCAGRWVTQSTADQQNTIARQITARLTELFSSSELTAAARDQVLLAIADFGLRNGTVSPTQLVQPLNDLLDRSQGDVRAKGQAWLIGVLAAEPTTSTEAIDQRLAELEDRSQYEIVWSGIEGILRHQPQQNVTQPCNTQLKVVEKALTDSLTEQERDVWLYRKSDALINLGQYEPALEVLATLEQRRPRDAAVKLRIARATTRLHESDQPDAALSNWRRLAMQLKPHSDGWYEAKYNVAKLLEASGKKDDARKVLEHLQAIPPGWDNSKLKSEFEELLAKCRK